ncbi:MAG TPA: glycosyltransferase family 2 protein [Candidatus Saccharimonadales bacterium]|nr:glycosyltransferase family 2 protein [Candidatus Saccharimonadales bacterium]
MPDESIKVSIVIPVHNEGEYIGACLESLMRQIDPADEIIVVNNNSTDNTVKIAKTYPVKILHEKTQGLTPTRNRGFNNAKYEIIARTDGDTILPSNWITMIKKSFSDENLVAVSGPAEFYDLPELFQNSHWQSKPTWVKLIKSYNKLVKKMTKHDCIYGPNYAIRKKAWKKVKNSVCLNDKQVHEDLDLAIHLSPFGKIKFDNSMIVKTSVRRWKKPDTYLEYLYRGLKSINKHKGIRTKEKSKMFVRKIVSKASLLIN